MSDLLNYMVEPEDSDEDEDEDYDSDSDEEEEPGIDDSLPALERLNKYSAHYLMLNRLHITRDLKELCQELTLEEALENLPESILSLGEDSEAIVRQTLVEQMVDISKHIIGNERGYKIIISQFIPLLTTLLADINVQVRVSCSNALYGVGELLKEGEREEILLNLLKQLTSPGNEEEHRVEAILLQNRLAPFIGKNLCQKELLPLLIEMHKDQSFRIRKAIAGSLEGIIKLIDTDTVTDQILPIFVTLSEDEMWGVRKACSESIAALSSSIRHEKRPEVLLPIFKSFCEDQSRWVRSAAFQNLGPFIATFDETTIDESLIRLFLSMTDSGDSDLLHYAGFNFPGVIQTCSKKYWHLISGPYLALCQDLQWKVRSSLAHSIHEVSRILGRELTESTLLPVFDLFLKDLDEVKTGVIKHMSEFLSVTSPEIRKVYLKVFTETITEQSNWRFRRLLSKQLGQVFRLYTVETCCKELIPLALHLLKDPVCRVRKAAEKQIGQVLSHLSSDKSSENILISELQSLAKSNYYVDRQTFSLICGHLIDDISSEKLSPYFLSYLFDLSSDKVTVVRVMVSNFFSRLCESPLFKTLSDENIEKVKDCCSNLRSDRSQDVRQPFLLMKTPIFEKNSSQTTTTSTTITTTPALVATSPDSASSTILVSSQLPS